MVSDKHPFSRLHYYTCVIQNSMTICFVHFTMIRKIQEFYSFKMKVFAKIKRAKFCFKYMLWVAWQTCIPAAIRKPITLLLTWSIKAQYRSLCSQKPGTTGPYILHVTRNSTKSSLDDFSWSSLLKKREVELLTTFTSMPL